MESCNVRSLAVKVKFGDLSVDCGSPNVSPNVSPHVRRSKRLRTRKGGFSACAPTKAARLPSPCAEAAGDDGVRDSDLSMGTFSLQLGTCFNGANDTALIIDPLACVEDSLKELSFCAADVDINGVDENLANSSGEPSPPPLQSVRLSPRHTLACAFKVNPYATAREMSALAKLLELDTETIRGWFERRRALENEMDGLRAAAAQGRLFDALLE